MSRACQRLVLPIVQSRYLLTGQTVVLPELYPAVVILLDDIGCGLPLQDRRNHVDLVETATNSVNRY